MITLNYSSHVIEGLLYQARSFPDRPRDRDALTSWADDIRNSVKYQLPDNGQYISRDKPLPVGMKPQRLPFKLVSLEIPFSESRNDEIREEGLIVSTKRHILAREVSRIHEDRGFNFDPVEPDGIHIQIVSWIDDGQMWIPSPSAGYLPYDDQIVFYSESSSSKREYYMSVVENALPDYFQQMARMIGYQQVLNNGAKDMADEVRALVEFLQVLACRNVEQKEIAPPEKLNKRRIKKGLEPFDIVRTLTVDNIAIGGSSGPVGNASGYQVREHLRTGHIRRLADRQVWVRDTIVAAGSNAGRVAKEYRVN